MRIFILMAAFLISACEYSNYSTHNIKYHKSEYVTNASGAATETLVMLGYEIDDANYQEVKTKVETLYVGSGRNILEFQTWIKVFTDAGWIKAYCTQRRLYNSSGKKSKWKFDECTSPFILERVDTAVSELRVRLEVGL